MKNNYLFTSESVSEGHPDKICDRISDAVVDLMLNKYSEARVACETMVSTNRTIIAGEYIFVVSILILLIINTTYNLILKEE